MELSRVNDKSVGREIILRSSPVQSAGGLQQIMIFYEDGDSYANEIADRVMSSVELIQLSK
jgi:hypothetical protein